MNAKIEVVSSEPVSPHNAALYEAGKALLVGSVEVGCDFCKSMIPVATGAIPIHIALIAIVVGNDFRPSFHQGLILTLAPAAYLAAAAAAAFAIGYFPTGSTFSLDIPEEIEAVRKKTLERRKVLSIIGSGLLGVGVILTIMAMTSKAVKNLRGNLKILSALGLAGGVEAGQ